jgi:peptidoglycan/LPS O-acetylase OafA/YrhL
VIVFTLLFLVASALVINTQFSHLLIFIERIPNFFIGIYVAERFINAKSDYLPQRFITQLLIVTVILSMTLYAFHHVPRIVLKEYGLYWYPLIIMTYPLICVLVTSWDQWQQKAADSWLFRNINRLLTFIGHHSLEFYLTHVLVYRIFDNLSNKITLPEFIQTFNIWRVPEYCIYIIISLIGAVILKKAVDVLLQLNFRTIAMRS